jgi:hypothetical protein
MIAQEIITYVTVAIAAGYTIYQFVSVFVVKNNNSAGCCGCAGECSVKK